MVLTVLAVGLGVVTVAGNDFRFTRREVTFGGPQGSLVGVLTEPRGGDARGLVVMVHGDGPVEATQDGLYSPWFEAAADAVLVRPVDVAMLADALTDVAAARRSSRAARRAVLTTD